MDEEKRSSIKVFEQPLPLLVSAVASMDNSQAWIVDAQCKTHVPP
jgi:hypothetical protein